jgi:tetratricopeptide (TPR) repeat protein
MDTSVAFADSQRYWGFISYSHRDGRWAEYVHRTIERYRVPAALVGRDGRDRPVPRQIFPVFRDRDELASSPDLSDAIRGALEASSALIVICSPAAAASLWVNQEILLFKRLGRSDRVFAVIVDGEPNASSPDRECFPAALRFHLRADGTLSDERGEPVAADLRPTGDGREDGVLKVIAGLLGVPFNELKRRELVAARRRARIYQGIAAAMVALALFAVAGGWMAVRYAQHAESLLAEGIRISANQVAAAVQLADQSGISRKLIDALLRETDQAFQALHEKVAEAPRLPWRTARAPGELRAEHGLLLLVLADHYGIIGETARQSELAARARAIFEQVAAEEPAKVEWQRNLARSYDVSGSALAQQWQVEQALTAFRAALDLREDLLQAHSDQPMLLRDVALSRTMVGDMLRRQGDWAGARQSYQAAKAIGDRLLRADPDHRAVARDKVILAQRIGDMLLKERDLDQAEAAYREAVRHAERLAAVAPDDVQAQRDLSVSYDKLGQILRKQGDLEGARQAYTSALDRIRPLAEADHDNIGLQRDLAKSCDAMGVLLIELGDEAGGRAMLEEALALNEAIVQADPGNALFRRELTVARIRLGDVLAANGEDRRALTLYQQSLAARKELANADAGNAQAWRDLAIAHERAAQQFMRLEALDDAVSDFRRVVEIQQKLANDHPGNEEWMRELAASLRNLGRALDRNGDAAGAIEALQRALAVHAQVASLQPLRPIDRQGLLATLSDLAPLTVRAPGSVQTADVRCQALTLIDMLGKTDAESGFRDERLIQIKDQLATRKSDRKC